MLQSPNAKHISQDLAKLKPTTANVTIPATEDGSHRSHRLSIESSISITSGGGGGGDDDDGKSTTTTATATGRRDRLQGVDITSALTIGGGCSRSRSSSNSGNSGSLSSNTAAPSPETSSSSFFFDELSPAGTPVAATFVACSASSVTTGSCRDRYLFMCRL